MDRKNIEDFLIKEGLKQTTKRFKYLIEAVMLYDAFNEPYRICVTKDIYPQISKKYHITWDAVGHGIRLCAEHPASGKKTAKEYVNFVHEEVSKIEKSLNGPKGGEEK